MFGQVCLRSADTLPFRSHGQLLPSASRRFRPPVLLYRAGALGRLSSAVTAVGSPALEDKRPV
jgi:hypothetical protein